jgi:hypothetical protein
LYVQKKRSRRPYLGFYLQRHKTLPNISREASINRLIGTFNGDDLFSAAANGLEYESAILYNATVRGSRKSLYKHRQSNSEPEDEIKRTSVAKQGLGYIDERAKVLTYFKLWCSPGPAMTTGVNMRRTPLNPITNKNTTPSPIHSISRNRGAGNRIHYAWMRRKKVEKMTMKLKMSFASQWLWEMSNLLGSFEGVAYMHFIHNGNTLQSISFYPRCGYRILPLL